MKINKRIGSCVPVENVDPHTGSFLDYGIIEYWIGKDGNKCQRKDAVGAMIEKTGRKFGGWNEWCENHCWKLDPFISERYEN